MYERDLVVAAVAVGLGIAMIRCMWINSEWCFRLNTAATLEQSFGRTGARWILGAIGAALIWIGGQLIAGPFFSSSATRADSASHPVLDDHSRISWNESR